MHAKLKKCRKQQDNGSDGSNSLGDVFIHINSLSEAASFTFRFKKDKNIFFSGGSLDVADDGAVVFVVEHFNSHLCHTTSGPGSSQNLSNFGICQRILCISME